MKDLAQLVGKKVILREKIPGEIFYERVGAFFDDERFRAMCGRCYGVQGCGCSTRVPDPDQPCYTFIQPMYKGDYDLQQEMLSRGYDPRAPLCPTNPILQLLVGVNTRQLKDTKNSVDGASIFENISDRYYSTGVYLNDAQIEWYNDLVVPLKKAGFFIMRGREWIIAPREKEFPLAHHIEKVLIDEGLPYCTLPLVDAPSIREREGYFIQFSWLGEGYWFRMSLQKLAKKIDTKLKNTVEGYQHLEEPQGKDLLLYLAPTPEHLVTVEKYLDLVRIQMVQKKPKNLNKVDDFFS